MCDRFSAYGIACRLMGLLFGLWYRFWEYKIASRFMGSLLILWDRFSTYKIAFRPITKIKVQGSFIFTEQMCDHLSAHGIASRPIAKLMCDRFSVFGIAFCPIGSLLAL
ncbi:hypothetical protein M0802_015498 [Mischocyttarus mexicanus]|nr:hypothetical protein M0802_015498 [Mischocyttarus mexicanus]